MQTNFNTTLYTGFSLQLKNSDTVMGQYYAEDDWSVSAVGESIVELRDNIIKAVEEEGGIVVSSSTLYRTAVWVMWGDKPVILEKANEIEDYVRGNGLSVRNAEKDFLMEKILYSDEWSAMCKRLKVKLETEQEVRQKKENAAKEERERQLLKELQEKYNQ